MVSSFLSLDLVSQTINQHVPTLGKVKVLGKLCELLFFSQNLLFGHTILSNHCCQYKEDELDLLIGTGDFILLLTDKLVFLIGTKEYICLGIKEPILFLLAR